MKEKYLEYTLNLEQQSKWIIVVQNDVMEKLDMCIQEIGDFYINDISKTERQGLESYQIVLNLSGNVTLNYHQKEYKISPGTLAFVDCREHYVMEASAGTENLFVHFDSVKGTYYHDYFMQLNGDSPVFQLKNPSMLEKEIRKLLEIFDNPVTSEDYFYGVECMIHILTQLIREIGKKGSKENSDTRITSVMEYIALHYAEKITLENLAEQACVSKFYLEKIFRRSQKCTPMEYLNRVRIAHSKELLRLSECSVSEIGNSVGFENISYFIRLFRRYENMTPHQYRASWRFINNK